MRRKAAFVVAVLGLGGCMETTIADPSDACTPARRALQASTQQFLSGSVQDSVNAASSGRAAGSAPLLMRVVGAMRGPDAHWDQLYSRHGSAAALDAGITEEVTARSGQMDTIQVAWAALSACRVGQATARRAAGAGIGALRAKHDEDVLELRRSAETGALWAATYQHVAGRLAGSVPGDNAAQAQLRGLVAIADFGARARALSGTAEAARAGL